MEADKKPTEALPSLTPVSGLAAESDFFASATTRNVIGGLGIFAGLGLAATWVTSRVKIAGSTEYIVRTGLGIGTGTIDTVSVNKWGVQWPFQRVSVISMIPKNYKVDIDAMSSEKFKFVLPGNLRVLF